MRNLSVYRMLLPLAVAGVLNASVTHAQVAPGERLRVVQGTHTLTEGVYTGRDSLGYAVLLSGSDSVRLPMDGSYTAERFAGQAPYGFSAFKRGLAIGGGAALVLAGLAALPHDQHSHDDGAGNLLAAFGAVLFTVGGMVGGAIMSVVDHDVWEPVVLTPASTSSRVGVVHTERVALDSTMASRVANVPSLASP